MNKIFFSIFLVFSTCFCGVYPVTPVIHKAHLSSSWYPHDKDILEKRIENYFSIAKKNFYVKQKSAKSQQIKAVIAPHAGYDFSGLCASSVYRLLKSGKEKNKNINRVIILAPSHNYAFTGLALPDYDIYRTALGDISVDKESISTLNKLKKEKLFKVAPRAHMPEHSLEVQLPFLQSCISDFSIVPLVIGDIGEKDYDRVAGAISGIIDNKTLVVVSSDFIHYGPRFAYTPFKKDIFYNINRTNSRAIEAICEKSFVKFDSVVKETGATICGRNAIKILLKIIELRALGDVECRLASYYSSPQIKKSSVSYAGLVFTQEKLSSLKEADRLTGYERRSLLRIARDSIESELEKKSASYYPILSDGMKIVAGAFVTLNTKAGRLRGCVGRIIADKPLYKTVADMAKSAAFHDSRFLPVKKSELDNLVIDITVLTRPKKVASYKNIVIGKHGIILKKRLAGGVARSAVFLPKVPGEFGWDLETTLDHLGEKAGLKKGEWRVDCEFEVFEGFEVSE